MNLLDIDIREYAQDIIDAYVEVYGERHRDIITQRFNRIGYITYNNPEGMMDYVHHLEGCKKRELSLKFLERIGIDITEQKGKSFSECLSKEHIQLLQKYTGEYVLKFSKQNKDILKGIMAWSEISEEQDFERLELEKINFLNFYRDETREPITKENFKEFCQTEEYNQILEKIQEYLKIYKELVKEYDDYLQSIDSYRKYAEEETKRKEDIEEKRKNEFQKKAFDLLPKELKNILDNKYKNIEEKYQAFLIDKGNDILYIENFSDENENILNYSFIDEEEKEDIYYERIQYLRGLGVEFDETESDFETFEEFYNYCITQENIKNVIPTPGLVAKIKELRKEAAENAEKEFIYTSEHFKKNIELIGDTEENRMALYDYQRTKLVCITRGDDAKGFWPLMFYTVRENDGGSLDFIFLHEGGHGIESDAYGNDFRSGFDIPKEYGVNPYNQTNRKYERMNETIADMLAMETLDVLHKKGIYIFEPKEIVDINIKNRNTNSILKNLLKRFMIRYRDEIIDARIDDSYMKKLYYTVGKDNFEELNDVINRVDYLLQYKGLNWSLKYKEDEDPVFIEYQEQLERLDKIYENMEKHKLQNESDIHIPTITISQLIAAINGKQKESDSKEYDE